MHIRSTKHRPRTAVRLALATAAALAALGTVAVAAAAPAGATTAQGCSGVLKSIGAKGQVIDGVRAKQGVVTDIDGKKGPGLTLSNPMHVDNAGAVRYKGHTDAVVTDHHWHLTVIGIDVASGGSANKAKAFKTAGVFATGDHLALKFTGLMKVHGSISGTGGGCTVDGFVRLQGSRASSATTWLGILFTLGGVAVLVFALPKGRRTGKSKA